MRHALPPDVSCREVGVRATNLDVLAATSSATMERESAPIFLQMLIGLLTYYTQKSMRKQVEFDLPLLLLRPCYAGPAAPPVHGRSHAG
jgi:hypothetical protein